MTTRFLLVLSLIIAIPANAQDCKYLQNKVSGMDGTRLVITEPVIYSNQKDCGNMEIWSTVYSDTAVVLAYVIYFDSTISVSQGDTLTVALEDKSPVYLLIHQNAAAIGSEMKKLTILTVPDHNQLQQLERYPAYKISVNTSQGMKSFSTKKKKKANTIRYLVGCVKSYLKEN